MIWQDAGGERTELEVRDCADGHARLVAARGKDDCDPVRVCIRAENLESVVRRLYEAAGQPAPVSIPRPEVETGAEYGSGPLTFKVAGRGRVQVNAGAVTETWAPSKVRQVAGLAVAVADAAESEPDPAEVDALAMVLMEGNPGAMGLGGARPTARRILAAGYRRDDGRG